LLICAVEEIANRFNKGSVGQLKSQTQKLGPDLVYKAPTQETPLYEINELRK
jgi:hypothetical protein